MKKILFFLIILSSAAIIGVIVLFFFQEQKKEETKQPEKQEQVAVKTNQAQVEIVKGSFSPATLKIAKGDIVVWTNKDTSSHQVASDPYPSNDAVPGLLSDPLAAGDSFSFTFNQAGTFTYHDNLNPQKLNGTIVVE